METKLFDYPILAVLAVLAVLGVVRHPTWSMYGYYLVALMRPNEMSHWLFEMRLSLMEVGATLVGFGVMITSQGLKSARGWPVTILILMVLHMFLSGKVLTGKGMLINSFGHWDRFDYYWKMAMMAWIATKVFTNPKYIKNAMVVLGVCGGYLSLWQNYRYFVLYQNPPLAGPGPHLNIWAGLFADRNDFAMMFSMSVPMFWYVAQLQKRFIFKMAWLGLIPFALHAVLLTESRGGLLGIIMAMGYITWHSKRRVLMSIAGLVGMVVFVALFATEKMLKRYGTIANYEQDASAMGRKVSWAVGMRMAFANPVWGRGMNNFVAAYYDYQPDYRPKYRTYANGEVELIMDQEWEIYRARQAHNMWVQTGGELGILGIALLALYIITALIQSRFLIRWKIKAIGDRAPPDVDLATLQKMLESPFMPYLTTGFFLSMQHFEYIFILGALGTAYNAWLKRYLQALEDGQPLGDGLEPPGGFGGQREGAPPSAADQRPGEQPRTPVAAGEDRWGHFPPPRR